MCHGPGSSPPYPPIRGGSGSGREIELKASDDNRFAAFSATTDKDGAPAVVLLPDVRGLHGFYQELALQFTEAGIHATAIDYFGRTAGASMRGDDFEFMPHVQKTRPETVDADVAAAVAHVRTNEGGGASKIFTVGFCFGGRASFNQAASNKDLSGVIGFYGRVAKRDDSDTEAPILQVRNYKSPVLGLFGGADQGIPMADVEAFRSALDDAGVQNEITVYDGAPHSFFDRKYEQFATECEDAWKRILNFIEANS
jgi:carboxymethylenebutenolidase